MRKQVWIGVTLSNLPIYPNFSRVIVSYLNLLNCKEHLNVFVTHTVEPGYGDAFKEDQEQETHSTGRVVVKQLEHIDSTLVTEKQEKCYNFSYTK